MALTDTFVKNVKPGGSAAGEKHTDGQGLYLHVKDAGKYWRMSYRYAGKQKILSIGVYPTISLAKARQRRDKARELLADGIDPNTAKREEKLAKVNAAGNTFKSIAQEWHAMKVKSSGAATTSAKRLTQMKNHIFPAIGNRPVAEVKPASAYSGERDRRFRRQRDRSFRRIVTAVTARGVARSDSRFVGHDGSLGFSCLFTFGF